MRMYIHIYMHVCTCIQDVYMHLYTHRHTFKVVFPLKLFNASPPSVGKYASSSACTGPCSLCVSFCHPISSSFFEPYTSALKRSPHTLALCLTAFIHRPSSMIGTKWHKGTCLFLGLQEGRVVRGGARVLLDCFPPPQTCPAYKSPTAACLLCAVHAKGSQVNSCSCLIHFADTRAGPLSIITSLEAKTEGKMKAERKYLVTRGN